MATGGDGKPILYQVKLSEQIKDAIRKDYHQAVQQGRAQQFLASLRSIYNRLQRDPKDFGETLFHLPALRLVVFQAIVAPIAVIYALHEDKPLVFFKAVFLLG